jgi:hypothetical protein
MFMNRDNQPQSTLDIEKPEAKPMDRPVKDDRPTSDQSRPEEAPRQDTSQNDGPPQPLAHPPEDTFVSEDSHLRPGQKSR